jgi:elongation factor G
VCSGFAFGIAEKTKSQSIEGDSVFAGNALEQFQQKCAAALRPELIENKKIEHFGVSKKNGNALSTNRKVRESGMEETDRPLAQLSITPRYASERARLKRAMVALVEKTRATVIWIDTGAGRALIRANSETALASTLDHIDRTVDTDIGPPQVICRATIARTTEVDYTHRRQNGVGGEFARILIAVTPDETAHGLRFHTRVPPHHVPKEFIPGIERGLRAVIAPGEIEGDPIVDIGVTLLDGAFHDIDSTPLSFEIAASMAMEEALRIGELVLSEPIMRCEVEAPDEDAELILSDLKSRRAHVERQEAHDGRTTIHALAPLAELFFYRELIGLRFEGRASCSKAFDHYELLPPDDPDPPFRPAAAAMR